MIVQDKHGATKHSMREDGAVAIRLFVSGHEIKKIKTKRRKAGLVRLELTRRIRVAPRWIDLGVIEEQLDPATALAGIEGLCFIGRKRRHAQTSALPSDLGLQQAAQSGRDSANRERVAHRRFPPARSRKYSSRLMIGGAVRGFSEPTGCGKVARTSTRPIVTWTEGAAKS